MMAPLALLVLVDVVPCWLDRSGHLAHAHARDAGCYCCRCCCCSSSHPHWPPPPLLPCHTRGCLSAVAAPVDCPARRPRPPCLAASQAPWPGSIDRSVVLMNACCLMRPAGCCWCCPPPEDRSGQRAPLCVDWEGTFNKVQVGHFHHSNTSHCEESRAIKSAMGTQLHRGGLCPCLGLACVASPRRTRESGGTSGLSICELVRRCTGEIIREILVSENPPRIV